MQYVNEACIAGPFAKVDDAFPACVDNFFVINQTDFLNPNRYIVVSQLRVRGSVHKKVFQVLFAVIKVCKTFRG